MRNYPKNRKSRDTSYSQTQRLIKALGIEYINKTWQNHGMFKTAEILSKELNEFISPYVIRYMSDKFNWIRIITDKNLPIFIGVLNGSVPREYYKHIIFMEK
jgi:hypothetical protein